MNDFTSLCSLHSRLLTFDKEINLLLLNHKVKTYHQCSIRQMTTYVNTLPEGSLARKHLNNEMTLGSLPPLDWTDEINLNFKLEALKLLVMAIGDQEFTNSKDSDGNISLHLAVAHNQVEFEKDDWLERTKRDNGGASLIATMAFQVRVNPPGGVRQDTTTVDSGGNPVSVSDRHRASMSIFTDIDPIRCEQF
ncbi:serine/threonine-protein phosphatase 6 regulatory Ankyrin repeat subunit A-like [Abeliophyllum distichum]|uniref:Serine/threonine-protein phosphatase 6 regulatory Ankyrin repeat subunit A-like n=1 Tax=Abeliophyllum distichum TaxID=126358 RepID=A0ABD1TYV8_9LAMI